jgi:calcium-dependent protein kinase
LAVIVGIHFFEAIDNDGNGSVDYTEFIAATLDSKAVLEERALWDAFSRFDLDGNGKISKDELKTVLSQDGLEDIFRQTTLKQIMTECDQDGDGEIDFQEFLDMMRSGTKQVPEAG